MASLGSREVGLMLREGRKQLERPSKELRGESSTASTYGSVKRKGNELGEGGGGGITRPALTGIGQDATARVDGVSAGNETRGGGIGKGAGGDCLPNRTQPASCVLSIIDYRSS